MLKSVPKRGRDPSSGHSAAVRRQFPRKSRSNLSQTPYRYQTNPNHGIRFKSRLGRLLCLQVLEPSLTHYCRRRYERQARNLGLTALLRNSMEPMWARLRQLLPEHGVCVEPFSLRHFPDDTSFEFGVVVTNDRRVYRFGLDSLHKSVGRRPLVRAADRSSVLNVFSRTTHGRRREAGRAHVHRYAVDTSAYRGSTSRRVASWIPPLLKITCPLGRLMSIRNVAVH